MFVQHTVSVYRIITVETDNVGPPNVQDKPADITMETAFTCRLRMVALTLRASVFEQAQAFNKASYEPTRQPSIGRGTLEKPQGHHRIPVYHNTKSTKHAQPRGRALAWTDSGASVVPQVVDRPPSVAQTLGHRQNVYSGEGTSRRVKNVRRRY
jgi:hypothetical protein